MQGEIHKEMGTMHKYKIIRNPEDATESKREQRRDKTVVKNK